MAHLRDGFKYKNQYEGMERLSFVTTRAKENGILVLNGLDEVSNGPGKIAPVVIKDPSKKGSISFNDLNIIAKKFKLKRDKNFNV